MKFDYSAPAFLPPSRADRPWTEANRNRAARRRRCDEATLTRCAGCGDHIHRGRDRRVCANGHRPHVGKGYCETCRSQAAASGVAPLEPNRCWRRNTVLDEWVVLRGQVGFREFADRVGMTYIAWERMFLRAQRDRDPRAVRFDKPAQLRRADDRRPLER